MSSKKRFTLHKGAFLFGGEGEILCVGMILTADAVPKIIILPRDSGSPLCFAFRLLRRTARVLTLLQNKKTTQAGGFFALAEKEGYGALSILSTAPSRKRQNLRAPDFTAPKCYRAFWTASTNPTGSQSRSYHKNKKRANPCGKAHFLFGGEGGIRTLEPLLMVTRFPIVRARPTTRLLQTRASVYKALDYYNSYCHKNQVFFIENFILFIIMF